MALWSVAVEETNVFVYEVEADDEATAIERGLDEHNHTPLFADPDQSYSETRASLLEEE